MARPLSAPLLLLLLLLADLSSPARASEEEAEASTEPAPESSTELVFTAEDLAEGLKAHREFELQRRYHEEVTRRLELRPAHSAHNDIPTDFFCLAKIQDVDADCVEIDAGSFRLHQEQLLMANETTEDRLVPLTLAISRYYLSLTVMRDETTRLLLARYVWAQLQKYPCSRWNMTISPLGSLPSCSQFVEGEEEGPAPGLNQTRMRLPLIALITLTDKWYDGKVRRVSRHLHETFASAQTKMNTTGLEYFKYGEETNHFDHAYRREFAHYEALLTPGGGDKADAAFIERAARFLDRLKYMAQLEQPYWLDRFEAAAPPSEAAAHHFWDSFTNWLSGVFRSRRSTSNETAAAATATAAATALFGGILLVGGILIYRHHH